MYKSNIVNVPTFSTASSQGHITSPSTIKSALAQKYPDVFYQQSPLFIQNQNKLLTSSEPQMNFQQNIHSGKNSKLTTKAYSPVKPVILRFINEKSGVKNKIGVKQADQSKDSYINNQNLSLTYITSKNNSVKLLKTYDQSFNQSQSNTNSFGQTFPSQQIFNSQIKIQQAVAQCLKMKDESQQNKSTQIRNIPYLNERQSDYIKRTIPKLNLMSPFKGQSEENSPLQKPNSNQNKNINSQLIKSTNIMAPISKKKIVSPTKLRNMNTVSIISPNTNIIEENIYQEDREEIEQLQGQGMEKDQIENLLSYDRTRKKSITLFEMHYDTVENEMLEELRQRTLDDNVDDSMGIDEAKLLKQNKIIQKLKELPKETLQKAKLFKVLVNGVFDEREFYVDIGQIPQEWKLRQFARILNKMYSEQQGNKFELKQPIISILIGKVHTKRLDQLMKLFELIDLAVQGKMGQDNLLILEEFKK